MFLFVLTTKLLQILLLTFNRLSADSPYRILFQYQLSILEQQYVGDVERILTTAHGRRNNNIVKENMKAATKKREYIALSVRIATAR